MIEVLGIAAAGIALAGRELGCPGCGLPLRRRGQARGRIVRELGGALVMVRPGRAWCPGCGVTRVVPGAGLIPRRACAAALIGRALAAAALGSGRRRVARGLAVPAGAVRGWIRAARRCAARPRITGIRACGGLWLKMGCRAGAARASRALRWSTWGPRRW